MILMKTIVVTGMSALIGFAAPTVGRSAFAAAPHAPTAWSKPNGVIHGIYCGLGDKGPGLPPTDALDRACLHHDACTHPGREQSCACNARFVREAHAVSLSRREPGDERALAVLVEAAIPAAPCRR